MSGEIVSFDVEKASRYVDQALHGFMNDPPDSDYQRGFLAALLVVYEEGCGKPVEGGRFAVLCNMAERAEP